MQEERLNSIQSDIKTNQQQKGKSHTKPLKIINYTQLRTLKSNKPQKFLAGLQQRSKSFIQKPHEKLQNECLYQDKQPKLLRTALSSLKKQYEINENIQNENNSNRLSLNYFNSRQTTPNNPFLGVSLHKNSVVSKKRMRTHQTNKSRLQSINSDIDQKGSQGQSVGNIVPIYKQKDFKLYDKVLGQSEAAYHYAFGKQRKISPKLIHLWKQCLFHEDKTQIFVPVNPQDSNNIPYTHPRIFPLNQLQKGFQEIYGSGKNRCLKAGEQALIIQAIKKYISKCDIQPMKITRKDYDIIAEILSQTKLTDLQNYFMCYRQIQAHFRIMVTRWKYQNVDNKSNRMFEPALIHGKNNFVDLGKHSILSQYLLNHSNRNQLL